MSKLLEALRHATGLPLRPGDVIVQRNVGSWAGGSTDYQDHMSWRGFNLLLLDRRGQPRHYAKCRPGLSGRAARERGLHLRLSSDEVTGHLLPGAREVLLDEVAILLLDFVDGPALRSAVAGLAWLDVRDRIEAALVSARILVGRAAELGLVGAGGAGPAGPRPWRGARHWLERAEVTPAMKAELRRCMELVDEVPPVPQHGDLTVDNILEAGGRLVFLDLETLGECDIPLRDDWSMLRSLASLRDTSGLQPWWRGAPAQAMLDRGRACGMSSEQAWATLPAYLADYAGTLMARGVPSEFVVAYVTEVESVLQDRCSDPGAFS